MIQKAPGAAKTLIPFVFLCSSLACFKVPAEIKVIILSASLCALSQMSHFVKPLFLGFAGRVTLSGYQHWDSYSLQFSGMIYSFTMIGKVICYLFSRRPHDLAYFELFYFVVALLFCLACVIQVSIFRETTPTVL